MKRINHTGKKFNKLLAVGETKINGRWYYLCKCDCGNETTVHGHSLISGHTKSCGCIRLEIDFWKNRKDKPSPVATCDGIDVYLGESKGRFRHYVYVLGTKIWLHHYLANTYIRKMLPHEIVHHIDFNPLNNSIKNLLICTRAEHIRIHKPQVKGYKFTPEQIEKLSRAHIGQIPWNKGKLKVNKDQAIEYLKVNQTAKLKQIMEYFNIKTDYSITKLGGLKFLKLESMKYE